MTEASATNSGTNSGQSSPSGPGSKVSQDDLSGAIDRLLKRGQTHGELGTKPQEREQEVEHEPEDTGDADEAAGDTGERDPEREAGSGEADRGEAPGERDQAEPDGEQAAPGEAADGEVTLRDVARRLKIPVKELYKVLTIPLSDGTGRRVSVEELKAAYVGSDEDRLAADRHALAEDKAVHEKSRQDREAKLVRDRRELDTAIQLLGDLTPAPVLEALGSQVRETAAREAQHLLDSMPQFRDRTVFQAFMGDAHKTLAEYGFSQAEVQNMSDHRIFRFLDAHMRLAQRISEIENLPEQPREPPKTPRRRSRAGPDKAKALAAKAKQTGHEKDKVAAIGALIGR